ncbi:MAG: hypothetical protein JW748_13150 [Anaerolineales bacterium]|nr:hypothetical protein [Anaerolineales bacterium]
MHLSYPMDMWEGIVFIIVGPIWGIFALIVTIPLEAVFLKIFLHQSTARSIGISGLMNFVSALCGAATIFFSAFFTSYPEIYIPLFFLGTLLIEYPFLFRFLQPAASFWKIILYGLLVNIASHVVVIGSIVLFSWIYLSFSHGRLPF